MPRQDGPLGSSAALNGGYVWPNIHGPAFIGNDLSLYKTFKVTESKSIQFRMNAFNFLNHPLSQFGNGNDINLTFPGLNTTEVGDCLPGENCYNQGGIPQLPTSCSLDTVSTVHGTRDHQVDTHPSCNSNGVTTGKPQYEVGRRVMEFAVKFIF